MASERVQRQIDRLLDQAEEAVGQKSWTLVRENAQAVLDLDPDNGDARTFLAAAERIKVDPADCVAFEDGDAGLTSAREAGMRVVDIRPMLVR